MGGDGGEGLEAEEVAAEVEVAALIAEIKTGTGKETENQGEGEVEADP